MAKKKQAHGEATGTDDQASELEPVRLRAPKNVASLGIPTPDGVVQVDVPKGGIVEVEPDIASLLLGHGFERVE
jgi:hypothetical protein